MSSAGFALIGLAAGAAIGAAAVAFRRLHPPSRPAPAALEARLEVQAAELRRLADAAVGRDLATEQVRSEVAGARRALEELSSAERARRERDAESWRVVQRLSTVLAGGAATGRAGENVLREQLAALPPGILATDVRVNGKVVEFGLVLSDGRRLPVDSKWSAAAELEALEAAEDPAEREARARDVERIVAGRAREVAQYLDPALTTPVAVAAVPDAAYAILRRAHADAFSRGVILVPYSSAMPVLLFLYSLVRRFGDVGDAQACLSEVATLLDAIEGVLENKIARAGTMIANGADELRSQLGKARGSVARGRAPDAEPGTPTITPSPLADEVANPFLEAVP